MFQLDSEWYGSLTVGSKLGRCSGALTQIKINKSYETMSCPYRYCNGIFARNCWAWTAGPAKCLLHQNITLATYFDVTSREAYGRHVSEETKHRQIRGSCAFLTYADLLSANQFQLVLYLGLKSDQPCQRFTFQTGLSNFLKSVLNFYLCMQSVTSDMSCRPTAELTLAEYGYAEVFQLFVPCAHITVS